MYSLGIYIARWPPKRVSVFQLRGAVAKPLCQRKRETEREREREREREEREREKEREICTS
jgi:uncharacterized Zn finger protein (UPF0148 family)